MPPRSGETQSHRLHAGTFVGASLTAVLCVGLPAYAQQGVTNQEDDTNHDKVVPALELIPLPTAKDAAGEQATHRFTDITDAIGLGPGTVGTSVARCVFADLNDDGFADAVIDRDRVFLNLPTPSASASPIGREFVEVVDCGLPEHQSGSNTVFADLDNDGHLDALMTYSIDGNNPKWEDHGRRTCWRRGHGDGTFEARDRLIYAAPPKTTASVAIGDVNLDGKLDLFLGNWYMSYGEAYDGYSNDLLLQSESSIQPWPIPSPDATTIGNAGEDQKEPGDYWLTWWRDALPSDGYPFTVNEDLGGRPTYGTMIANLDAAGRPELIELNYGRRWNRVWQFDDDLEVGANPWRDIAPTIAVDGDDIRHGAYPDWLKERAKEDARFDRPDEPPFRANGNTFDCSVSDVDNDGDFDLFISEIAHGWAGDSSDRSRLLLNQMAETGTLGYRSEDRYKVDRIPPDKNNWNQGDLFCQLADLDNDGLVDLLLSSGDYPDNQRLRYYRQTELNTFEDATEAVGIDHDGSQQVSLADINGDGALDVMVGQTFFRYTKEMKEGREPRLRVFLNQPPESNRSIELRLEGDPNQGTNRDALGAIVRATVGETTMSRQLIGVGGHSGKDMDFVVHFGIGKAEAVDSLTVIWPNADQASQTFENIEPGLYRLTQGDDSLTELKTDDD